MLFPLVTICVPTIGRPGMLEETLSSVQSQTYEDYEVLILDNASPTISQELIHSYCRNEPRARVLRCEARVHMFENFSRGIVAASGKYLAFFHDDDIYLPRFLQHHVSLLEANPRVGFSGSNCLIIDGSSSTVAKRELIRKNDVWPGRRYIAALLRLGINIFPMQSVMFRTCILDGTTFDRSLEVNFSDFVILMRIAEQHDVGLLAASLLKMRTHADQASQEVPRREAIRRRTRLLLEYCSDFALRWPNEERFGRILRRSVHRSRQIGLLWSWISSRNEEDARSCLADLNQSTLEIAVRTLLMQVDNLGMSFERRQKILMPALRRIGHGLGKRAL